MQWERTEIWYIRMEDIKARTASGENHIFDNLSLGAKSDVWEEFGVTTDCENNVSSFVNGAIKCDSHEITRCRFLVIQVQCSERLQKNKSRCSQLNTSVFNHGTLTTLSGFGLDGWSWYWILRVWAEFQNWTCAGLKYNIMPSSTIAPK